MILRTPNTDLLVRGKPLTYLSSSSAAGAITLTVESIASFSVSNYIQVGETGAERTEIVQVHASTAPSGSTITLTSSGALYAHEEGTALYKVDYNQSEFSIATTETGSKSVLATSALTPDLMDTIYDDATNSTGFGFWRFKNSATSTYSGYSDAIPYAGYVINAVSEIFDRALSVAGTRVNPRLKHEDLYSFLNDFITLANSYNKRWSEAKVLDEELATLATGNWEISLPSTIAQTFDPSAIISLRISGYQQLNYVTQREYNNVMIDMVYSKLNGAITTGSTSIILDNSAAFADSGSVVCEGDVIDYTTNTRSTDTLSGVTGIVAAGHADDSYVFQRPVTGIPTFYTLSGEGKIRLWPIASSGVNDRVLFISYYKRLQKVDSLGDKVLVQDISPAIEYCAYRIKKHEAGGTLSVQDEDFQQFIQRFQQTINRDTPGEPRSIKLG